MGWVRGANGGTCKRPGGHKGGATIAGLRPVDGQGCEGSALVRGVVTNATASSLASTSPGVAGFIGGLTSGRAGLACLSLTGQDSVYQGPGVTVLSFTVLWSHSPPENPSSCFNKTFVCPFRCHLSSLNNLSLVTFSCASWDMV